MKLPSFLPSYPSFFFLLSLLHINHIVTSFFHLVIPVSILTQSSIRYIPRYLIYPCICYVASFVKLHVILWGPPDLTYGLFSCRHLHGAGGGGPVPRRVPALGVRGGQGHVRAVLVRRLPRLPEQLPHAGGMHQRLLRRQRWVDLQLLSGQVFSERTCMRHDSTRWNWLLCSKVHARVSFFGGAGEYSSKMERSSYKGRGDA